MDERCLAVERFVAALGARDFDGVLAGVTPDVRFRYLIPSGPGEIHGAADATAKLRYWFGDVDALDVRCVRVEALADRVSARYRFVVHDQDGWQVVEQQTYLDVDDQGRITAIDLLCSGFRPTAEPDERPSSGVHRFDAGTLGCADGLAQEFRRRISAVPAGDVLVVDTSDPAAKQDLPPLARMMGHTVRSVEPTGDGRLSITVERGR